MLSADRPQCSEHDTEGWSVCRNKCSLNSVCNSVVAKISLTDEVQDDKVIGWHWLTATMCSVTDGMNHTT